MPFAHNNGIRIFYKVVGDGSPLVLHHGLGATHEEWSRTGYVEALKGKYRLILMDARGRGKSDKPHGPENHSMEYMVGDVVAVLDDLGIDKAHFWGDSMGGRVALAAGRYAPDRFSSLIVGCNGLSEKDSKEEMEELQGLVRIFEQGADAVIAWIEKGGAEKWRSGREING